MGSKNHEVVPTVLIAQISGLRSGGVNKFLGSLAKRNLVSKVQNAKCETFSFKRFGASVGVYSRRNWKMMVTDLHTEDTTSLRCELSRNVVAFIQ